MRPIKTLRNGTENYNLKHLLWNFKAGADPELLIWEVLQWLRFLGRFLTKSALSPREGPGQNRLKDARDETPRSSSILAILES